MGLNRKCPKCGSTKVQLSNERSKLGCLFTLLFGIFYIFVALFKYCIGFCILIFWDWWMAIIKASQHKGYVWQSKKWFSGKKQIYFCHDCGYNFRA